jgi:O-antigen/teichoic acid export membrane protein
MNDLIKKVILNLGAKGVSVCLALGMHIFFARWLSSVEYGQFVLLQVICLGLAVFSQAGMQNAYMKLVAETDNLYGLSAISVACGKRVLAHLAVSIPAYILISFFLYTTGKIAFSGVLLLFFLYMVGQTAMFLLLAWYRAVNKAYLASFLEQGSFSGLAVLFSFIWILSDKPFHLHSAAMSYVAGIAIILIVFSVHPLLFIWRSNDNSALVDINRIKQLSRRFLTIQTAIYISNWGGLLIVGFFLASEQVAELNIAQRLAQMVTFFLMSFNGVVAPRFAALNSKNNHQQLRLLAQRSAFLLAIATVPVVLVSIIFGKYILAFFGPDYIAAYPVLLIIMCGQFVNAMTGSVGFLLNMTNHENVMRNVVIASSVFSVISAALGTMFFGVMGAAIAISLTVVLNNLSAAYFVFRCLGFVTIPGFHWVTK